MVRTPGALLGKMIRLFEDRSHVEAYAMHRPTWPPETVTTILGYLNQRKKRMDVPLDKDNTLHCKHLVDVGCGGGQSTSLFARYCDKITAIDPSPEQIRVARRANIFNNVSYMVGTGEKIPVDDNSVELVCCGQSVHWLDWKTFFSECRRVLVPHGCMAAYTYVLPRLEPSEGDPSEVQHCNQLFMDFYRKCNFHPQRRHVDNRLAEFFEAVPNPEKSRSESIKIVRDWNLSDLQGYISTWSGYRNMEEELKPELDKLIGSLRSTIATRDNKNEAGIKAVWDVCMILSPRPV